MQTINIHETQTHLSRLLELVIAGEEFIIAKAGHPVARLAPLRAFNQPRQPGALAGSLKIADDFDAPLPEPIASAFRGEQP
ncbi:MAG: type II toxin-antitoxin system prevent-host-death family antitoxin [Candidatus Parabeggiatoa sp. nov. 3]|jgi:antitoxin (DNA-binding transcriptional repressor) of toxin-antitoxin stability system|nr:MAG: type II toxin-antitoxin system prevent-host-death family antitoxin [Gammaproteobacteria bacterium]RKZ64154.1 MAG: type II toxin-antitoxin system prevent-host-death family antitoxin [Gammaproteobacteria bacterium]RKZ81670.1 MAG: type II toxin-antitoxin system prevent-host-death family antitoxin [Gammaproteobacteria bacterium]HEW98581.1 type II toxin-antitoxin system Phd/YefM family antitoxin [Beggiatoa sp.]